MHNNITESLNRLREGNQRFVSGVRSAESMMGHLRLKELAANGQRPFATVLTCSDSRVPAELLFDQGLGDLFVIRVAGNVVQPSQIASIEYAVEVLKTPLCLVMGHSGCGAVNAAVQAEQTNSPPMTNHLGLLIDLIRPAVKEGMKAPGANLLDTCIRTNVTLTSEHILDRSTLLNAKAREGSFAVVEAVFQLETGVVEFKEHPVRK